MKRSYLYALLGVAILALGFLAGFKVKESLPGGERSYFENLQKFQEVVKYVNENYFKEVNNDRLIEDALRGMLKGLDPHTFYISPEEMKEMNEQMQGSFDGIGVEFNLLEDTIYVVTPLSGGPSEKLGIMAGDRIVAIDGKTVAGIGLSNNDVFKYLRGPRGTHVKVGIRRAGVKELLEYDIVRDKIPVNSVDYSYMPQAGVGYIRMTRFAETTFREFREHLRKLKAQGMQTLILDLRGNPGGYLEKAEQISDDFLPDGKLVVYTEGRIPASKSRYEATSMYEDWEKGGLIVLIDYGSASASEIVAGAVQDWDRGLIVGTRSFGKGLVQSQKPLPDGSAVRMVISRYFTPSGRCIQKPFEQEKGEKYDEEIFERVQSGELYDPSKIKLPDSLKYKTASGRTVYGGGGIIPDVFIPRDTLYNSDYLLSLFRKDAFRKYAYKFLDRHAEVKTQYKDGFDFANNFAVTDEMLRGLTTMAAENGVPLVEKGFNTSKPLIVAQLKAAIGHSAYGEDAARPVLLSLDKQYTEALKLVSAANELARTGKFRPELTDANKAKPNPANKPKKN
jgi:carboxyl-terminal processing protease